jgi:hypothetical protein
MSNVVMSALSREELEDLIDKFLLQNKPFKPIRLVLPVHQEAGRFSYKGLEIRLWYDQGIPRYDTAVEITGASDE